MNAIAEVNASAKLVWFGNTLVSFVVPAAQGQDGLSMLEHWMPFTDSPPLHIHETEDELFHVISGTMRFVVGGTTVVLGAGDTVLAPKGVPHTYCVDSPEGAHCLTITRGGDFERMVRAASRPATMADLPPRTQPDAAMIEALVKLCAEHHIVVVGAPLV